jgi:predicted nucleic acid-binding protein
MGLVLDSSVLIAAERDAKSVSDMLVEIEQQHGQTEIVLSAITVVELETDCIGPIRLNAFRREGTTSMLYSRSSR